MNDTFRQTKVRGIIAEIGGITTHLLVCLVDFVWRAANGNLCTEMNRQRQFGSTPQPPSSSVNSRMALIVYHHLSKPPSLVFLQLVPNICISVLSLVPHSWSVSPGGPLIHTYILFSEGSLWLLPCCRQPHCHKRLSQFGKHTLLPECLATEVLSNNRQIVGWARKGTN